MRVWTVLRVQPAAWLALPLILLSLIYAASYQPASDDPYNVALTAAATVSLGFVAPVCAALAAWEGGRLRRAEWWNLPHVRSLAGVATWSLVPVVLAGLLAVLAGAAVELAKGGLLAVPDLRLLGLSVLVIAAHSVVGFAVGLRVPVVIAAPSVLIGSYLWMAFPRAMEPLWLRHLNGSLSSCCLLQDELAPRAVAAAAVVAAGMVIGGATLLAQHWRWRNLALTLGALVLSFVIAVPLVAGMGPDPAVPRNAEELVCRQGSGVTVCVWPEHTGRLDEVLELTTQAVDRWEATGLPVPTTYSEQRATQLEAGSSSFGFSRRSSRGDILHALAYGLLPPWPPCADTGSYPGFDAQDAVHAWYDATAGMSMADLAQRFPPSGAPGVPSPLDILRALRATSPQARAAWLAANLAALASCDRAPQLLPS
jgi:hypothetical protein